MYDAPLAPHEIDRLPDARRVWATIRKVEEESQAAVAEAGQKVDELAIEEATEELRQAIGDLYAALARLLNADEDVEEAMEEAEVLLRLHRIYETEPEPRQAVVVGRPKLRVVK